MPNPLFEQLNQNNPITQMINQFNQFRQTFNVDPKAEVQSLLNSGRMTQGQFNKLQNAANMFARYLK